jgi:hypothetical protein
MDKPVYNGDIFRYINGRYDYTVEIIIVEDQYPRARIIDVASIPPILADSQIFPGSTLGIDMCNPHWVLVSSKHKPRKVRKEVKIVCRGCGAQSKWIVGTSKRSYVCPLCRVL